MVDDEPPGTIIIRLGAKSWWRGPGSQNFAEGLEDVCGLAACRVSGCKLEVSRLVFKLLPVVTCSDVGGLISCMEQVLLFGGVVGERLMGAHPLKVYCEVQPTTFHGVAL